MHNKAVADKNRIKIKKMYLFDIQPISNPADKQKTANWLVKAGLLAYTSNSHCAFPAIPVAVSNEIRIYSCGGSHSFN